MPGGLNGLYARGLDKSTSGRRLDQRTRRHAEGGLADAPREESDFLARRPSQDFTDSDLRDMNLSRPAPAQGDPDQQYANLLRQQARIPMYDDARNLDPISPHASDYDHPLFARADSPDESSFSDAGAGMPSGSTAVDVDPYDVPNRRMTFREGPVERSPGAHLPATPPWKYAAKGFARHYLDDPAVTAPVPQRPKARGFFAKLRSFFSGKGWR